MGITIPNDGYRCYDNKFSGCWASKTAYRTEYYNAPRNSICNSNITPYMEIDSSASGTIDFSADSFFNRCSKDKNDRVTCSVDTKLSFNPKIVAGNRNERVKYVSEGVTTFRITYNNETSVLYLVDNSISYQ